MLLAQILRYSILVDHNQLDGTVAGVESNGIQNDYFNFSVTCAEFLICADAGSDGFIIDNLNATVVPMPAAVWLFSSGLLGLVGLSRLKTDFSAIKMSV